jgi:predicted ribosome quality control (RQC) complex YloA/Tae2 family protein
MRFNGNFADMNKSTLQDAVALALKFSKAGSRGKVTVTRCGNIYKPCGTVAGLVGISGEMKSIRVELKHEKERLKRLETQIGSP